MKYIIKKILYKTFSTPFLKRLVSKWSGPCCILMFHRVCKHQSKNHFDSPNRSLFVSDKYLDIILSKLSKNYKFVDLDGLLTHLNSGSNEQVLAVTFDDGYLDNLTLALPILEKYQIPATIFITSRFLEGDTKMWWFELWEIIKKRKSIEYSKKKFKKKWKCITLNQKEKCYKDLRKVIMKLNVSDQNEFFQKLEPNTKRKDFANLCLDWENIQYLDNHPLITIGSHTHTHLVLSRVNYETVKFEMEYSKKILEKKLGHKIKHIAYPYGSKSEVGLREFMLAQKIGYETGLTTNCYIAKSSNKHSLPRLAVIEDMPYEVLNLRIKGLNNFFEKQFA